MGDPKSKMVMGPGDEDWVSCWNCLGAGGWHDCGEDCCSCLEPDENEICRECEGEGGWYRCPFLEQFEEP